jgi:DNA-binding beta-propeller fold protein YncE
LGHPYELYMYHSPEKGTNVTHTERTAKSASTSKIGFFAALRALLRDAEGTGAPALDRLRTQVCVALCGGLAILAVNLAAPSAASAGQTHLFQFTFNGAGEAPEALGQPYGIAVDNSGTASDGRVYVADISHNVVDIFDPAGEYLSRIDGSETVQGSFSEPRGLAVDQSNGDLYVVDVDHNVIDKFDSAGKVVKSFGTEGQLSGAATPQGSLKTPNGVAVDPKTGDLYVADFNSEFIDVFDSAGKYLRQFPSGPRVIGDAVDSQGNLFVTGPAGTDVYVAATGQLNPAYGNGTGLLDSGQEADGVAVDPVDEDVYVFSRIDEAIDHNEHVAQYDKTGTLLSSFGFGRVSDSDGIGVGEAASRIYVANPESGDVAVFDRASVPLPTTTTAEATDLASTSATLNGEVNPEGLPLEECFFEYGKTEKYGETAPCEPAAGAIGSGTEPVKVHADVTGLTATTAYHFRLAATDENGIERGADQLFGEPPHIDATSVAVVTSSAAELQARIDPGGVVAAYHFEYLTQAAYQADGESFSGPEPAAVAPVPDAAILSARTDQAVSQPVAGLTPETTYYYRVVAANSAAPTGVDGPAKAFVTHATAVETGLPDHRTYELVSPSLKSTGGGLFDFPEIGRGGGVASSSTTIQVTEDGSAIIYPGEDFFESPPSGLPAGSADQYTSFRGSNGWTTRNTTGEDPEEAFAPLAPPALPPAPVLPPAAASSGQVLEQTPDGSVVFFSDVEKLTPDSTAAAGEPDLYRYDVESEGLTDLSVDANSGEHADVQGVLGVGGEGAEAGSYVYFVADGVLASGGISRGDCAPEPGFPKKGSIGTRCNLYLSHAGTTTFITALSARDNEFTSNSNTGSDQEVGDWAPELGIRTAEVSPSGRYAAFGANEELTAQPAGGPQVFRYDAVAKSLLCASCNPDGSTSPTAFFLHPNGAGGLRQHYIANDGRLFFNDLGPLVPRDVNGRVDVYEFEDAGTGTCQTPGGCRSLISGGGGTGDSYLAAVSAEGNDVFFTSNQQLSSEDRDASLDMYDARVDGRTPPEPPPACETAEGCHGLTPPPPIFQSPASAAFHGPGNAVEKTCKKGFVRNGAGCVKKHTKARKHHKRAGRNHGGHK